MKNFFKPFAIFACAALLLGACTDEETTDLAESLVVAAPDVVSIQPGNSRFQISWRMSTEKIDLIDHIEITYGTSTVTFTAEDGLVSGENSLIIAAEAGTYDDVTITAVDITGTLSVSQSFGSVTVYDQDTYAAYASEFKEIQEPESGSGEFKVIFEDLYVNLDGVAVDDCQSWYVSYYTINDDTTPTGESKVRYSTADNEEGEGEWFTYITDARSGSSLLSTVVYYPDNTIGDEADMIKVVTDVTADNDTSIPVAPAPPTSLALTPVYTQGSTAIDYTYSIDVEWTIDEESTDFSYAKVFYTVDGVTTTLEDEFTELVGQTSITVPTPNKAYTITVQAFDEIGYSSSVSSVKSDTATVTVNTPENPTALTVATNYDGTQSSNNSIVKLAWTVPADENITSVVVKCAGETYYMDADAEYKEITGLPADVPYSDISVATYSYGYSCAAPLAGSATTFNASSYDDRLPSVSGLCVANGDIQVTWSQLDSDLISVEAYYGDQTEEGSVSSGELSTADFTYDASATTITFQATFQSEGAEVPVTISGGSAVDVEFVSSDCVYDNGTYLIYSAKGLVYFADVVNGTDVSGESPATDAAASGMLMANINLNTVCGASVGAEGTNWTPIGDNAVSVTFTGTFDGNNKVISGLYINDSTADYAGLFGLGSGATIENLTLDAPYVVADGNSSALICSALSSSIITNCHLTGAGTVNVCNDKGIDSSGIAGLFNGVMKDCTVAAEMTIDATNTNPGSSAGGVGCLIGRSTGSTIINCHNNADFYGARNVAGIVGYGGDATTFIGCSNSGNITSPKSSGGMLGKTAAKMTLIGCYNTGENTGASENGGLTGCGNSEAHYYGCYSTALASHGAISGNAYNASIYMYSCYYDSDTMSAPASGKTDDDYDVYGVSDVFAYLSNMNEKIASALDGNAYVSSCVLNADGTVTVEYK